jgi:hypothetical protein
VARLDAGQKRLLKEALCARPSPWIIFGLESAGSPAQRMGGLAGIIDWHLHGQVSSLLSDGRIANEEFCLFPGGGTKSYFLMYQFGSAPDVKKLLHRLQLLKVEEFSLAESTFPEDFLSKLKQTLKKEGIRCTKLEPDSS